MLYKRIILLGLAALTLAEPIPQAAPTTITDDDSSLSAISAAIASESAEIASLSGIATDFAGMPTIPYSVLSVLATAIPTGVHTNYATLQLPHGITLCLPTSRARFRVTMMRFRAGMRFIAPILGRIRLLLCLPMLVLGRSSLRRRVRRHCRQALEHLQLLPKLGVELL